MNLKFLAFLFPICFLIASCGVDPEMQRMNTQSEVAAMLDAYRAANNAMEVDKLTGFYSTDAEFYWVEDGKLQYPDRETLLKGIREFYPSVDSLKMEVFDRRINVVNAEHANVFITYKQDMKLKGGYEFSLEGAITALMKKENGEWKFFNGHSSVKKPRNGNSE